MTRLLVDWDRCEGHGLCVDAAPALLALDEEGELVLRTEGAVLGDDQPAVAAVQVCPVGALRLT
ncbi:MAG TPA: ferredoxin [Jatrophihabitans sp.]|jgi:ferredoxin|uniref:ferredoxin n=1 Tax=Jatrophihabitans sp. TaxID=1932789 RepID=UPI002EFF78A8